MAPNDNQSDADLLGAIRQCTACPSLPLGPRPILQWDRSAPILIAGQAPGSRTHHKGIPFDDPSGDRLRSWLGIDRDLFYDSRLFAIVPMAFCFPGTGARGDLPPPVACADRWRSRLIDRMTDLRLTIVLGRYAMNWHGMGGGTDLTSEVRRWRDRLPRSILLPHPSPRNNRWLQNNPWFERELLPELRLEVARAIEEFSAKRNRSG